MRNKIAVLPDTPGVYTYYDAEGTVIYVGKAKNLKRRVSSYFNRTHDVVRTNLLVRAIADMSYIVVPTEQDALNLEASMIKEYKPRYNVLLKDDKSYPWIVVTNEYFPRVMLTRDRERGGGRYYGPYANTAVAKTVLGLIDDLYPLRTCRLPLSPDYVAGGARTPLSRISSEALRSTVCREGRPRRIYGTGRARQADSQRRRGRTDGISPQRDGASCRRPPLRGSSGA